MPPRALQAAMDQLARGEEVGPLPGTFGALVGQRLVTLAPGHAVAELETATRHTAGRDATVVGGAVLTYMADVNMGMAYNATLEEGETRPTLELKINFLRPARVGSRLRAEARVLKSGGSTGYATCEITDAEGRLIAHATCTCMKLTQRPPIS